jgi:hypothetical protein
MAILISASLLVASWPLSLASSSYSLLSSPYAFLFPVGSTMLAFL